MDISDIRVGQIYIAHFINHPGPPVQVIPLSLTCSYSSSGVKGEFLPVSKGQSYFGIPCAWTDFRSRVWRPVVVDADSFIGTPEEFEQVERERKFKTAFALEVKRRKKMQAEENLLMALELVYPLAKGKGRYTSAGPTMINMPKDVFFELISLAFDISISKTTLDIGDSLELESPLTD